MTLAAPDVFASANPDRGWQARLELQFQHTAARTRLSHRRHVGPLLMQRPFYPEGPPCHVYVIHPPGGVVSGDELELAVEVTPAAHALLTTCAAGKFYRRGAARIARVSQTFSVDDGLLEWLPQENIYYPGAAVEQRTIFRLKSAARMIGWEIGCLGLPVNGLSLGDGALRQSMEIWLDQVPLLLERLQLTAPALSARWGLAGHPVLGTLVAFPACLEALGAAQAQLAGMNCADMTLACTLVDGVLCCRGYGARADRLKHAFVDLWQALRPLLLGRVAVAPRIWAT